jgi:hypothetical protein
MTDLCRSEAGGVANFGRSRVNLDAVDVAVSNVDVERRPRGWKGSGGDRTALSARPDRRSSEPRPAFGSRR